MKKILFVFLAILLAIPGFSQSQLQSAATVNLIRTEAITVGQLRTEVERLEKASNKTFSQAERLQVLDVMINERLVMQAAERDRVRVTDNEVNQQIQPIRAQMAQQLGRQPTDAEFSQAVLAESGLDLNTFREQLRKQLIVQKYLVTQKGELINSITPPTEDEIMSEYLLRRAELFRPDTIRFTMIQVPFGDTADSRAKAKTLAESLIREINNDPSKFDEVTARHLAPNSGFIAGDAGYLPRNAEARQVVGQEFLDVAFNLRQGQVSRLIEGRQGFQIIKITENYSSRQLELSDGISFGNRVTVREYIGQFLFTQKQQIILAQASQELISELRTSRTFQVFENNIRW